MLDDNAAGLVEFADAFDSGIGIGDIVVGKLFTLKLFCSGDAGAFNVSFFIESRFLVRVFTVAQILRLFKGEGQRGRVADAGLGAEVARDEGVIVGGVLKDLLRQKELLLAGDGAGVSQAGTADRPAARAVAL